MSRKLVLSVLTRFCVISVLEKFIVRVALLDK